ncbi:MAG: SprT-like domain-containing protein [Bacteroidia bacterium]|nr:SprT-like domain-containing protein [Bacteroidia bacterium]
MTLKLFESFTEQQLEHKAKLMKVLQEYLPNNSVELCSELIMFYRLHLHIEVERKGRYGDYMPHSGKGSRISINHNLSRFEFLITFVHELAHHTTFVKYGNNHDAHGVEWKNEFKICMRPFFELEIFPYDLKATLAKHMQNPKYSQSADVKLLQVLRKYDDRKTHILTLSQLEDGDVFKMKNEKHVLKKIKKLRTYILCETLDGQWKYRVHAMVEVQKIQTS